MTASVGRTLSDASDGQTTSVSPAGGLGDDAPLDDPQAGVGSGPVADARRRYRRRVLKGATIIKTLVDSEIECLIRNQHEDGAELKIDPDSHVPSSFLLYVAADGVAYRAEVKWRHGERVGVQFTGAVPKPPFHYG